jgi:hypothetical protein
MRHGGNVRNFEWVIRDLVERGHSVHLAFHREHELELADRLASEASGAVTTGLAPIRADVWQPLEWSIGRARDYLRYLEPRYRDATFLRRRAERDVPKAVLWLQRVGVLRWRAVRRVLAGLLRHVEEAVPVADEFAEFMRAGAFDVLLVTPMVSEPSQRDFLLSAQAHGYPAILAVHSWDNLTNKGLIRALPDRVYVWNELQRREAVELHGIPTARVAVVGAHSYDHWFEWKPATSRDEFCRRVGLDPGRPFLLYVGSSVQIAPDEPEFVREWLDALRQDEALREVGVLVRPHPYATRLWRERPLPDDDGLAVWPPIGAEPRDDASRNDYYDSMYHSAAVVGLNTSALHEAAIVGRGTYSLLRGGADNRQEGTLHFHYLRREHGGPLVSAGSLEQHLADLRGALRPGQDDGWREGYIRSFMRPLGAGVPAARVFVDDLIELVSTFDPSPPRPRRRLATTVLAPLARAVSRSRPRARRSSRQLLAAVRRRLSRLRRGR